MRTVTLELLRHGPAHNQLLSPLTPYLALCENHAPVTINVPFEHNQFLHRLTALTYEFGMTPLADNQRKFQLQDTGRELSRLLSAIPGLTAELNRHREQSNEVIHLRLILSASELALLPFELVLAGNGFPGFGQPLLLQNQAPVCLTREVRRVKDSALPWSPQARVLFVCATPAGLPQVPVEAHMLALRSAVDPWVKYFDETDADDRRRRVSACLDVLPAATLDDIQEACASGEYTHVHVLAHGVQRHDGFDFRFGIALHGAAEGEMDVVSGDRLASALRPLRRPQREGFALPMVVTLASCNGANGGSVVGAGASVAHALQEAGIPLVIAGQFPLTFGGSVELVQTLYEGLLWGTDPRALLIDLRRRMHVLQPGSHDWAALATYASLPTDFDAQLGELMVERAKAALRVAMDHADALLLDATSGKARGLQHMVRATERIDIPWQRMQQLIPKLPKRTLELNGLLASLGKRRAEVVLASSNLFQMPDEEQQRFMAECLLWLERSRDFYWDCFAERRDATWALVQSLALSLLLELKEPGDDMPGGLEHGRHAELRQLWRLAHAQSLAVVDGTGEDAGWALGNLVELSLLAMLLDIGWADAYPDRDAGAPPVDGWLGEARFWVDQLLQREDMFPNQPYSTFRQLQRYELWFGYVNARFVQVGEDVARVLAKLFPARLSQTEPDA
ncbi:CHAT domain-containing protein [Ramlibacter sp.]|uniref:CHAT domain-containing protein n=1 Tax=Ramlibacter sp. TaxID=1917967 RepID=UPI00184B0D36|nr:CHAT domain-containing protein [Ramlibacter sp.]MBA2676055.1 CHAT domain-containing protein [Ramlibacter sp.]